MKKYYLTTPLYYVNDVPHIGHAYTTIAADVFTRWKKCNGEKVFFLTGTDEHGQKIETAAKNKNQDTQDYINRIASEFRRLWTALDIGYDDFIQTTETRHQSVVQKVFEHLKKTGDIYKGIYEDWYCIHDESYFSESELIDKRCPSCGRDVQKLKEESYFFRLSRFEKPLLDYYEKIPEFLSPKSRANEIINFVKSGLRDLSVSRTRVKWGVPVVSDPKHVVYVWFDALLNYVSALGYTPEAGFKGVEDRWPADIHFVGKEIFRFHTVIWPAMLMGLDMPLPRKVFAHGWWTVEGEKMSKSLGNVVDPHKICADIGADAFRYFLLREVSFGSDGDFSEKGLLSRYNSELANNLGNLFQRTVTLLTKHFAGIIPQEKSDSSALTQLPRRAKEIDAAYQELAYHLVLDNLYQIMIKTNKYIDDEAPWTLGPDQKDKLGSILTTCLSVVKVLAVYLSPFMPKKMDELWKRMGETTSLSDAAPTLLEQFRSSGEITFASGQTVVKSAPLFMRKGGRWK